MTKQIIIERALKIIEQLPADKAEEVVDFAEFVMKRYEENKLSEGLQRLIADSQTFEFLNDEEDLYSKADLKQVYDAQR